MRRLFPLILIPACFATLFLTCYAPALFGDRQFGYRDAAHYYYPLYQRVQEEWDAGRWPGPFTQLPSSWIRQDESAAWMIRRSYQPRFALRWTRRSGLRR